MCPQRKILLKRPKFSQLPNIRANAVAQGQKQARDRQLRSTHTQLQASSFSLLNRGPNSRNSKYSKQDDKPQGQGNAVLHAPRTLPGPGKATGIRRMQSASCGCFGPHERQDGQATWTFYLRIRFRLQNKDGVRGLPQAAHSQDSFRRLQ